MITECDQCHSTSIYVVKDGGTVFCLDCLHFIHLKPSCIGHCRVRCMKCTWDKVELRKLADTLLKSMKEN